ncbi:MAG TPA: peptidase E [Thiotrichaceae bacterium]|jgi:dipeptidase E|nr:peptidase E [Thiotrichaceae bacterium]
MKRNIIAIGGGKIMVSKNREPQTSLIDQSIVQQVKRKTPKVLFIPTASEDNVGYCKAFRNQYEKRLGCSVQELLLYRNRPSNRNIQMLISQSDIIYVGGGNTLRMMKLWRKLGVDKYLDKARKRGALLCGLSAGAICWFRQGNSDSRKFKDGSNKTIIKVTGLNYSDLLMCPHYDVEKHRQPALKAMMKTSQGVAVALDNCAALHIKDDQYRILSSKKHRKAYLIYWKQGEYVKQALIPSDNFQSLIELTKVN